MQDCFPTYPGKCTTYEGDRFLGSVNLPPDISVEKAVELITAYLLSIDSSASESDRVDVSSLSRLSSTCMGKLNSTKFSYIVRMKGSGIEFTYNFKDAIENLPYGFNVVSSEVNIITGTGHSANLSGTLGGASFSPQDFPLNASFRVNVHTSCGLMVLYKEVKVPAQNLTTTTDFHVKDYGSDGDLILGIGESIKMLADKILTLDRKIDLRTNLKNGKSIDESLIDIEASVVTTQEEISALPPSTNDQVQDLTEQVKKLVNTVETLSRENTKLNNQIKILEDTVFK